jgi:hypothetical protein
MCGYHLGKVLRERINVLLEEEKGGTEGTQLSFIYDKGEFLHGGLLASKLVFSGYRRMRRKQGRSLREMLSRKHGRLYLSHGDAFDLNIKFHRPRGDGHESARGRVLRKETGVDPIDDRVEPCVAGVDADHHNLVERGASALQAVLNCSERGFGLSLDIASDELARFQVEGRRPGHEVKAIGLRDKRQGNSDISNTL